MRENLITGDGNAAVGEAGSANETGTLPPHGYTGEEPGPQSAGGLGRRGRVPCPSCDGVKKRSAICCRACRVRLARPVAPPPEVESARWVPLTRGLWALVDEQDYEAVSAHHWAALPRRGQPTYAFRHGPLPEHRKIYLHRFVYERMGGGPTRLIDHRNRNGLDCRRENLRPATFTQNYANAGLRTQNRSGFKGVKSGGPPFYARIRVGRSQRHLGSFQTAAEAARAYDRAAVEAFGEFACTNASLGLLPATTPTEPEEQTETTREIVWTGERVAYRRAERVRRGRS